ncbi:MAG: hypothetical protein Q8O05_02020 [Chloroflexota bacterium]|nr:hypothetical protein [Chloroflexota bacterium]
MPDLMLKFFISGFVFPNLTATGLLWGIGLSIVFGAFWLSFYWPPLFRKFGLWWIVPFSAVLTWAAIALVQIPLQGWTGQALVDFLGQQTVMQWLLLAAIPQILLSGLVQEGAKLVPVVVWWNRNYRDISPRMGLILGAVAGAAFGIFEAVWALNTVFAAGFTWQAIEKAGLVALLPFWERFAAVAFHIAASALAGYGLARGWGWKFYLLAAFLHGLLNYGAVLLQTRILTAVQLEMYASVIALVLTAVMLWLRWKKSAEMVGD